jgi:ribosomal protein L19
MFPHVSRYRASSLLHILKNEEFEKLKSGRVYPNIHAGDSVQIDKLLYLSSKEPVQIKGVVIGRYNKLSDTSLSLLNVENGTPVIRLIPIYSPLVQSIKILQKAFLHNGKKRVKRSKLYYLQTRDPEEYTVK